MLLFSLFFLCNFLDIFFPLNTLGLDYSQCSAQAFILTRNALPKALLPQLCWGFVHQWFLIQQKHGRYHVQYSMSPSCYSIANVPLFQSQILDFPVHCPPAILMQWSSLLLYIQNNAAELLFPSFFFFFLQCLEHWFSNFLGWGPHK